MAIRDKDFLKNKFKTGDIPTGQDFADFIDTFVASMNDILPDAEGNVAYKSKYNIIDPVDPTVAWSDSRYPEGTSVFITTYTGQPDWDAVFGDIKPPLGDIMVQTTKISDNDYCVQEVDAIKDGIFEAQFVRVNTDSRSSGWGPLQKLDVDSIITVVDETGQPVTTKENDVYDAPAVSDITNGIRDLIYDHMAVKSDEQILGHVKVDGTTIVSNDGVISAVGGGGGSVPVVDNLQSTSTTSALSANQGRLLNSYRHYMTFDGNVDKPLGYFIRNGRYRCESVSGEVKDAWTSIISQEFQLSLTNGDYTISVDTQVQDPVAEQTIVIGLYGGNNTSKGVGNPTLILKRSATGVDDWSDFRKSFGVMQGSGDPNTDQVYGVLGNLYYDYDTAAFYQLRDPSQVFNVNSNRWVPLINNVTVIDNITTDSPTAALSAGQGKQLNDELVTLDGELNTHMAQIAILNNDLNDHELEEASANVLGHVKVDNDTIVINNGVISVATTPGSINVVNNLTSSSSTDALSANQGRVIKGILDDNSDTIQNVVTNLLVQAQRIEDNADNLESHEALKASDTALGHVKVDGNGLKVDSNGVISLDISNFSLKNEQISFLTLTSNQVAFSVNKTLLDGSIGYTIYRNNSLQLETVDYSVTENSGVLDFTMVTAIPASSTIKVVAQKLNIS